MQEARLYALRVLGPNRRKPEAVRGEACPGMPKVGGAAPT